ncbi:MAG: PEP-utilizing enzyme [Candidatus Nanoarchaeia archaeon]
MILRDALGNRADAKRIAVLTQPKYESSIAKERRELLLIAKNKEFGKLEKHAEDYGWMANFNFLEKAYTAEDYRKEIAKIGNIDEELQKLDKQKAAREKRYNETVEVLNDPRVEAIAESIREFVNIKLENWEGVSIAGNNVVGLWEEIGKRIGLTLHEFYSLPEDEIVELLERRKTKDDVDLRVKKSGIRIGDGVNLLSDDETKKYKAVLEKKVDVEEFKGLVVHTGKCEGVVKKIMTAKELDKMEEGDVLVCPMTNPDYMPAIKKAKAIVTDEGGVLCHAAIVSREFEIPCIVGTKIATKALDDGDKVEVDAEAGVVRKLSQK